MDAGRNPSFIYGVPGVLGVLPQISAVLCIALGVPTVFQGVPGLPEASAPAEGGTSCWPIPQPGKRVLKTA